MMDAKTMRFWSLIRVFYTGLTSSWPYWILINTRFTILENDILKIRFSVTLQFIISYRNMSKLDESDHIIDPGGYVKIFFSYQNTDMMKSICHCLYYLPPTFASNMFIGFREEDQNVKRLTNDDDDGRKVMTKAYMVLLGQVSY